jgi:hypothetical protein
MNSKQLGYLTMTRRVLAHLDGKPALWNGLPPVANTVQEVRACVQAITEQGFTQSERSTPGYTLDKEARKEAMCSLAMGLVLKLRGYAKVNKDNVLLMAVHYSESDLRTGPEQDLVTRCRLILARGREYQPKLADYQVTKSTLSALHTAIDAFVPLSSQRDAVSKERTTATANIAALFDALRQRLDALDDLVPGLVNNADFVATYKQSRLLSSGSPRKGKPEEKREADKVTEV